MRVILIKRIFMIVCCTVILNVSVIGIESNSTDSSYIQASPSISKVPEEKTNGVHELELFLGNYLAMCLTARYNPNSSFFTEMRCRAQNFLNELDSTPDDGRWAFLMQFQELFYTASWGEFQKDYYTNIWSRRKKVAWIRSGAMQRIGKFEKR